MRRLLALLGCSVYKEGKRAATTVYQLAYKAIKERLANANAEYDGVLLDGEVVVESAAAENTNNACKNRYVNVLPFDYNRVKISGDDDYINASIVQSPPDEDPPWRYIAAQGPLATTVVDFWRMVMENNCAVIIMLTRTIENNHIKCADYFSLCPGEAAQYGDYCITTTSAEEVTQDVTRRTLLLKHRKTEQVHQVTHYHYHRWPDFGVPDSTEPIRRLVRLLWDNGSSSSGSTLVHCSAGIGRTGTLMAIDVILRRLWAMAAREGAGKAPSLAGIQAATDLPAVVSCLRRQRKGMVQTVEQYCFCYEAVLHGMQACMEEAQEQ